MADKPEEDSDYPELTIPVFESKIPAHLLQDATPQDKWLMEEMSKGAQADAHLLQTTAATHRYVRATNGKTNRNHAKIEEHEVVLTQVKEVLPMLVNAHRFYRIIFGSKFLTTIFVMVVLFLLLVVYPFFLRYQYTDLLPAVFQWFGAS